jgi:hypothetical protein
MKNTLASLECLGRIKFELISAMFVFSLLLTGCGDENKSDISCVRSQINSRPSADGRYTAVIEKVVCESGAETSYRLKISAKEVPGSRGWSTSFSLESDLRDELVPALRWTSELELEVSMPTRTIEGALRQHVGDNLTIRRVFVAKSPEAFPNYY